MDKVLTILEKRVEWVALGLAALWVLFIAWTYGVNSPVKVEVGGQAMSPGSVDEYIRENEANPLAGMLSEGGKKLPTAQVKPLGDDFEKAMSGPLLPALPQVAVYSPPPGLPTVDKTAAAANTQAAPGTTPGTPTPATDIKYAVETLPDVPAPTDITVKPWIGMIIPFVPQQGNDPTGRFANAPAATGTSPIAPASSIITAPVNPTGPGADVIPAEAVDKAAIKVFGKFNVKTLAAEFAKAKIPSELSGIQFLEVQLERQEVSFDGKPIDKLVLLPPLPMHKPPANRAASAAEFLAWAGDANVQTQIIQPEFYQIVQLLKGEPLPVPPESEDAAITAALNPTGGGPTDAKAIAAAIYALPVKDRNEALLKIPIKERGAVYKEVKALEAAENQSNRGANTPGMRGTGRNTPTPSDPRTGTGRGGTTATGRGGAPLPSGTYQPRGYGNTPLPGRPGMNPYAGGRGYASQGGGNYLTPDPEGNIWIWAYDETAEADRLYSYRMRVIIKNPVYQMVTLAKPELSKVLDLPAENAKWSEWSKPLSVPSTIRFRMVTQTPKDREQVKFTVWRWHRGSLKKSPEAFTVSPGDVIGGVRDDVDFTTGWTVVDIRQVGSSDTRVTLVNEEGRTQVRSYRGDSANSSFKELELQEAAEKAAAAAAALDMR